MNIRVFFNTKDLLSSINEKNELALEIVDKIEDGKPVYGFKPYGIGEVFYQMNDINEKLPKFLKKVPLLRVTLNDNVSTSNNLKVVASESICVVKEVYIMNGKMQGEIVRISILASTVRLAKDKYFSLFH